MAVSSTFLFGLRRCISGSFFLDAMTLGMRGITRLEFADKYRSPHVVLDVIA